MRADNRHDAFSTGGRLGLFDFIKGEFIDVIDWPDAARDELVWRFPRHEAAIKMGAQLTVREGQAAVLIDEGKLADVFLPGRHELSTANMPILTKLLSWKHGFESPFKVDVVFVSTRQFADQRWGTQKPVTIRDPELGPVRVRAFGTFSFRVSDPGRFLQEVVGASAALTTEDVSTQLKSHVIASFSDAVAEANLPVLDIARRFEELGGEVRTRIAAAFTGWGLAVERFVIQSVSLPDEVEAVLDQRSSMGLVGDLGKFTQFQAARAIDKAASNPGGAGDGIGLGAGIALGQSMAQAIGSATASTAGAPSDPAARLGKLKALLDQGLIDQTDFDKRKAEILRDV
jgi:membrane protease subunit (stomatin/prohibitin family)